MSLEKYNRMRDFKRTPEPSGKMKPNKEGKSGKGLLFVVGKHDASHLHYDFRLEMEGMLKSWAVPKGPSLDPSVKRLAMQVEDHPWSYRDFEGVIPEGNYGAGEALVWDTGTYEAEGGEEALLAGLKKGRLTFTMHGKKLHGKFALVRSGRERQWLLMKKDDEHATTDDITEDYRSVLSSRILPRDKDQKLPAWTKAAGKTAKGKRGIASAAPHKKSGKRAKITKEDLKPMLATLTDAPFDSPDWVYEVKWDGYRAVARLEGGKVQLFTRNGIEVTEKYAAVTEALKDIEHDAVLDGEIVALDAKGRPRFSLMQNAAENASALVYYVFDILFLDGEDVRKQALLERKEALREILPAKGIIRFSEHLVGEGKKYFKAAEKQELEGIMAKRADSTYRSDARTKDWLKIKTVKRQEVVIVGYTKPQGGRKHFGSLVLGVHEGKSWRYVGNVGTGFSAGCLKEIEERLQPLVRETKPVEGKVPLKTGITWVKPEIVCEVKFTEWTDDGHMRHPVFEGLRYDKPAADVVEEKEVAIGAVVDEAPVKGKRSTAKAAKVVKTAVTAKAKEVTKEVSKAAMQESEKRPAKSLSKRDGEGTGTLNFTHLDKIYWPEDGYTKGDSISYYERMAETILPYLKDRPMVLNRHPNGINKPGFYQKDVEVASLPSFVRTTSIYSESNDKNIDYVVCDNKETLLYMANLGCIEMNPWNSRTKNIDKPDFLVIDLDPSDNNTFEQVIKVAKVTHEVLEMSCEKSYVKTSGKTGIHIFIPLKGRYSFDMVRNFAELLVRIIHSRLPELTSLERSPSKRTHQIYLDWLQNRTGQTVAAAYSIRPIEKACVSAPLEWKEVRKGLRPDKFTIKNIEKRLKEKGDLWKGILDDCVDLKAALTCLQKELGK